MMPTLCPCSSLLNYEFCCARYIEHKLPAPHPEALMRSRYTAFFQNNLDYLKNTWHPDTYPEDLAADDPVSWIGLHIIEASSEGDEGEVEFQARFIAGNYVETLHEISQFDKIEGKWLYHSGEFEDEGQVAKKISSRELCPCGSSKIFKHCHAKK